MQFIEDFKSTSEEVKLYLDFVSVFDKVESSNSTLIMPYGVEFKIKRDLQKVIRANSFLILYNLVEATISNCISAIYDSIEDDGLSYEELSDKIRQIWLSQKGSDFAEVTNKSKASKNLSELTNHLINKEKVTLDRTRISLSGNLDYRSIKEELNKFGLFGRLQINDEKLLGKALLKVKYERNALAHGNKSFREASELITPQDLLDYSNAIIQFLEGVVQNTENYIKQKKYTK